MRLISMNTAPPEMLHCFTAEASSTDVAVLERQRASRQLEGERLIEPEKNLSSYGCFNEFRSLFSSSIPAIQVQSFQGLMGGSGSALGEVVVGSVKPDPGLDIVWPELETPTPCLEFGSSGLVKWSTELDESYSVSRASSCKPAMPAPAAGEVKRKHLTEKINSFAERDSFNKRKAEKIQNAMVSSGEDITEKKIKSITEEAESKIIEQNIIKTNNNNTETSADTSKENNSKASAAQKPDYIHVRARRGQATDSHSLAERVRREKISERMRYLQDLVPGCNKITGKAGMLDEIINYVQSLQRQVEFLSMKLAALNPRLDFNTDELFAKEVFPSCQSNFPNVGELPSAANNSAYAQFNPLPQMLHCSGLESAISPSEVSLRRTISAPASFIPETFIETSCFAGNQPPSTWNANLQNFYNVGLDQARSTAFPSHPYTASMEVSSLKMEM